MTSKEIEELAGHRPVSAWVIKLVNDAIAIEREAIAKMIEDSPPLVDFAKNEQDGCIVCGFTPKLAALTIRARGHG